MSAAANGLENKERALHQILSSCGSVLVGYSGGVDSVYLAKASVDVLGQSRVLAVTSLSPSYPESQRAVAVEMARWLKVRHVEISTHELDDPNYASNPSNRCFFCKTELYSRLVDLAREAGLATVVDGSNADDRADYRPGAAAARELGVRSPFQEAGLTKAEIRKLSQRDGLPTWDMPASPCLASRIPYGLRVTHDRLREIDEAESRLRALHRWQELRVRHHGDRARLELSPSDLPCLRNATIREEVVVALRAAGFTAACLDLEGYRRGSLNEVLELKESPA